jgi:hypothetical protein
VPPIRSDAAHCISLQAAGQILDLATIRAAIIAAI